jgi:hypothetical protein
VTFAAFSYLQAQSGQRCRHRQCWSARIAAEALGAITVMRTHWYLLAIVLYALVGCKDPEVEMKTRDTAVNWSGLAGKRILFAHQSVGANILNGISTLAKRDGVDLQIHELGSTAATEGITHFNVGRNGDPLGKIRDYSTTLEARTGLGVDIALMKLCYIDFDANTDGVQLADAYIASLDALAGKHPDTRFIAVTAPLAVVQTGPKAWIKKVLGKQPAQYLENARRSEFNEVLRKRYKTGNRLFDLARIEAQGTGANGVGSDRVESLHPALTDDGGHLNAKGEILVATEFLNMIGT